MVVMGGAFDTNSEAPPRESSRIFATHRDVLGTVVLLGDSLVAIGVPLALRGHAPMWALVTWSVLVVLTSYGWELVQRLYPTRNHDDDRIRDRWGWVSTFVWAALPWIVFDVLGDGAVAWALVFVVVFGVATDLLYESPADAPSFNAMLAVYSGSSMIAFAVELQFLQVGAVVISVITFMFGAEVWREVNEVLIERRAIIERDANTDSLTGLATRTSAIAAVDTLVAAGHPSVFCAFIDIDDFKYLNDNHGYATGDEVLKAVGAHLAGHLPASWTIARFGGDEFVAVGPEPADLDGLVETTVTIHGNEAFEIAQSLSVGVTSLPSDGLEAESLFREAGSALRHAKQLGKHQVLEVTDRLRATDESRATLGGRAGAALNAGEIVPWAQLIVDLESGEPEGMELLARWVQADGTVIPPNEFVPVIEEQGRGPALGLRMIGHAVEALARGEIRERDLFVSVNISARHLYHRRLPSEILTLLSQHHVSAERLILEITESQHLPSSPIWRETAHQLRTLGIGLAMDDLGTGYATVEQLLDVPFSHVKVDRMFTQALDRPGTAQLAAAFATIAAGAGMSAVVEGLETADQVEVMRRAGYRCGQGFYFHRPEPLDAVLAAVTDTARSEVEPGR